MLWLSLKFSTDLDLSVQVEQEAFSVVSIWNGHCHLESLRGGESLFRGSQYLEHIHCYLAMSLRGDESVFLGGQYLEQPLSLRNVT